MYSEKAKGVLMENIPPTFEASFFNGGPKVILNGNDAQIKEDSGACHLMKLDAINNFVSQYTLELVNHAKQVQLS